MQPPRAFTRVPLALLIALAACLLGGCTPGTFLAHRILRAPNSYPDWIAPDARVLLDFQTNVVMGLPRHAFQAPASPILPGDPARLAYRIVPPAAYRPVVLASNWTHRGRPMSEFTFTRQVPAPPIDGLQQPLGTVVLLHGYGLSQGSMLPWAFLCADLGWHSILVDLRGHGRSTGRRVSFGPAEVADLDALLGHLDHPRPLPRPIVVLGVSFGGSLALRWVAQNPALDSAIAIAPYPRLAPAIERIRDDFAPGVPRFMVRAAAAAIPGILGLHPSDLDPVANLNPRPPMALLMASDHDVIAPPRDVEQLQLGCAGGSRLHVVAGPTHEQLPFQLASLAPVIKPWLASRSPSATPRAP